MKILDDFFHKFSHVQIFQKTWPLTLVVGSRCTYCFNLKILSRLVLELSHSQSWVRTIAAHPSNLLQLRGRNAWDRDTPLRNLKKLQWLHCQAASILPPETIANTSHKMEQEQMCEKLYDTQLVVYTCTLFKIKGQRMLYFGMFKCSHQLTICIHSLLKSKQTHQIVKTSKCLMAPSQCWEGYF